MLFNKKYVCIIQHDLKDCGCACLTTICKQYGLKIPISKIREVSGTDKQGTSAYGIIKAAEQLGFTAKGVKANIKEDIFSEFPLPAIAHVVVEGSIQHYVVIHRISRKEILIADPAIGMVKYTPEDFFKIWTDVLIILAPTPQFKKGDETKGLFQRFLCLLKPEKKLLFNIFLASLIITVLGILSAFYFKFLMDDILPNNLNNSLHIISIGIIILCVFKILLDAFRTQLLLHLSQHMDIPLMLGYYDHVINLPMNFFGTREVGEIISRFNDASKIRDAISGVTLTMMIDIFMVVIGGGLLFSVNKFLFCITIIPIILYIIIVWSFNKPLEQISRKSMEDNAKLTSYLVESLNGVETIKAFNGERKANLETEKRFIKLIKSVFKNGWINNLQSSIKGTIKSIFSIAILWIGAYEVLNGKLSIGELLTFNALLTYFLDPIEHIINLQPMLQTAIVAADRLGEILDLDLEKKLDEDHKIIPSTLKGNIEIKNVYFRYGTRQLSLRNISMNITQGEKIALVGESGSGKTTLSKLLMNFYQCEKGEIFINNFNIKDVNIEALRDKIAYLSQDIFFFSGSIKENLSLGNDKLSFEDLIDACKKAKIHDFINSLPLRYDTLLEENASNLSGGQKQRLAIARIILRKPEILIMDEATSNLDSITEKAIEKTIKEFSKDITTIIIAHRLSTIMRCNKIYVMDNGSIVESGNHQTLLNQRGCYYNLWKEQLPGYEISEKSNEEIASSTTLGGAF